MVKKSYPAKITFLDILATSESVRARFSSIFESKSGPWSSFFIIVHRVAWRVALTLGVWNASLFTSEASAATVAHLRVRSSSAALRRARRAIASRAECDCASGLLAMRAAGSQRRRVGRSA